MEQNPSSRLRFHVRVVTETLAKKKVIVTLAEFGCSAQMILLCPCWIGNLGCNLVSAQTEDVVKCVAAWLSSFHAMWINWVTDWIGGSLCVVRWCTGFGLLEAHSSEMQKLGVKEKLGRKGSHDLGPHDDTHWWEALVCWIGPQAQYQIL